MHLLSPVLPLGGRLPCLRTRRSLKADLTHGSARGNRVAGIAAPGCHTATHGTRAGAPWMAHSAGELATVLEPGDGQ